jgi:short-subunit dehydrogenase
MTESRPSTWYITGAASGIGMALTQAKYAVEGLTDALVGEVEPLGINVTAVEPGPTATAFGANPHVADRITDYDRTVREVQEAIADLPPEAFDSADRVAAAILEVVDADVPPRRLVTGRSALGEVRAALRGELEELETWAATAEAVDRAAAA